MARPISQCMYNYQLEGTFLHFTFSARSFTCTNIIWYYFIGFIFYDIIYFKELTHQCICCFINTSCTLVVIVLVASAIVIYVLLVVVAAVIVIQSYINDDEVVREAVVYQSIHIQAISYQTICPLHPQSAEASLCLPFTIIAIVFNDITTYTSNLVSSCISTQRACRALPSDPELNYIIGVLVFGTLNCILIIGDVCLH